MIAIITINRIAIIAINRIATITMNIIAIIAIDRIAIITINIIAIITFKSSIWKDGPSPWDILIFKGHFEVTVRTVLVFETLSLDFVN